ncbi:hypothetical protein HYFRA_00010670 [Hymenoscyphus fraxineus]|uniref:Uncharacterized protein n=1 Tax=Hymenoscyphus fraxineus TaxID=746836 RepID=A0A9N9L501_9HELO|nr:hypothetical protein HYFRA_00010670 [Hymenoscyphus fraxineus]
MVMVTVTSTFSALETLPLLALERICQYLDHDDWDRQNLWSFTLASRTCCSVAAARRFCQITLRLVPGELERCLKPWMDVLNHDGRYRHVRRLKVLRFTSNPNPKPDQYDSGWNARHYFDMHDFCRPSENALGQDWAPRNEPAENPDFWVPLSRFIDEMPALQDLVWAFGSHMPRPVLSAVTTAGCRLHMHQFSLRSLIQFGNNPQPIDPDEYALATSSSLFGIVARVAGTRGYEGELNYNEEALMQMVAGMAPNLAYLYMTTIQEGQAYMPDEIRRLGRPEWSGFFCDGVAEASRYVRGSLQSLVCAVYVPGGIAKWTQFTDFTKLRCLVIPYTPEEGVALTKIATRGGFQSLETLKLSPLEDETPNAQKVLQQLLESVNPLRRLLLDGYFTTETLNIVLRRHGATLRTLSMHSYLDQGIDRDPPTLLIAFSKTVVEQLVAECPNLEQIEIPILRTEGDNEEAGIYRALSRLPRLKDAVLMLGFWIGPDEEYWDEAQYGPYPPDDEVYEAEQIPPNKLRIAFRNCAIDSTLALSIFNMIATGSNLRSLKIHTRRKTTENSPDNQQFAALLRWFNRPWVCTRDDASTVTVKELDEKETISCGKDWERASKNYQSKGYRDPNQDVLVDVFKSVWPPKTTEWWNDWETRNVANILLDPHMGPNM